MPSLYGCPGVFSYNSYGVINLNNVLHTLNGLGPSRIKADQPTTKTDSEQ
ncbi:MAG: hypothetical protein HS126_25145 [Anaerolineales bacterium]|nr:hypothetical protein [Anaerolineales bacterium]